MRLFVPGMVSRRAFAVLAVVSAAVVTAVPAAADVVYPTWYGSAVKAMDRMGIGGQDYPLWLQEDVARTIPTMTGDLKVDARLSDRPNGVPSDDDWNSLVRARRARLVYGDTTVDAVKLWDVYGKTYADGYAASQSGQLHYGDPGYVPTSDEIDEWSRKLSVTTSELQADSEVGASDASSSGAETSGYVSRCGVSPMPVRAASYRVSPASDVKPYSDRKMKKSEQYTELYAMDMDDGSSYANKILEQEAKNGAGDAYSGDTSSNPSLREMEWGRHATARDRRIHKRLEKVKKAHSTLNRVVDTTNKVLSWFYLPSQIQDTAHYVANWFVSDDDMCAKIAMMGDDSEAMANVLRGTVGIGFRLNCDEYDALHFPADGETATSVRKFAATKRDADLPSMHRQVPKDYTMQWSPWIGANVPGYGDMYYRFPVYTGNGHTLIGFSNDDGNMIQFKGSFWDSYRQTAETLYSKTSPGDNRVYYFRRSYYNTAGSSLPYFTFVMPYRSDYSNFSDQAQLRSCGAFSSESCEYDFDSLPKVDGDDPEYSGSYIVPWFSDDNGSLDISLLAKGLGSATLFEGVLGVPDLAWFIKHVRVFVGDPSTWRNSDPYDGGPSPQFGTESKWPDDFSEHVYHLHKCDKSCPADLQTRKPKVRVKATAQDPQGNPVGSSESGPADPGSVQVPASVPVPVGSDGRTTASNISYDTVADDGSTRHIGDVSVPQVDTAQKRLDLIDVTTGRSCFGEGYACADWFTETQQLVPDHQLTVSTKKTTKELPALRYKCSYDVPGKVTEVPIGECVAYAHAFGEQAQRSGDVGADPDGRPLDKPVAKADPKVDYGSCVKMETAGNAAKWLYEPVACAGRMLFKPDDKVTRTTRTKVERSTRTSVVVKLDLIRDNWRPVFADGLGECSGYKVSFKFAGMPVFDDADFLNACPGQPLDWLPVLCRAFLTIACALGVMLLCRRAFMAIFDFHAGGDGQ